MKIRDIYGDLPALTTDRLLLRKFKAEDMFEYASEPDVSKFIPWETHKTMEDTYEFLNSISKSSAKNGNETGGNITRKLKKSSCLFPLFSRLHVVIFILLTNLKICPEFLLKTSQQLQRKLDAFSIQYLSPIQVLALTV